MEASNNNNNDDYDPNNNAATHLLRDAWLKMNPAIGQFRLVYSTNFIDNANKDIEFVFFF